MYHAMSMLVLEEVKILGVARWRKKGRDVEVEKLASNSSPNMNHPALSVWPVRSVEDQEPFGIPKNTI